METDAKPSGNSAKPWLFKPGQCGNPNGRPRKSPALREMERVTREQATVVLEKLAGPALRVLQQALAGRDRALAVRCAIDVLDRTQGKAIQRIDATMSGGETTTIVTVEQLQAAARRLLATQATDLQVVDVEDVRGVEEAAK